MRSSRWHAECGLLGGLQIQGDEEAAGRFATLHWFQSRLASLANFVVIAVLRPWFCLIATWSVSFWWSRPAQLTPPCTDVQRTRGRRTKWAPSSRPTKRPRRFASVTLALSLHAFVQPPASPLLALQLLDVGSVFSSVLRCGWPRAALWLCTWRWSTRCVSRVPCDV